MSYSLIKQSFESLAAFWKDPSHSLEWNSVFVLPLWLEAWWRAFGAGAEEYLYAVTENEKIIGIAPLMVKDGRAGFIGSADVCDYMDFIIEPGKEQAFFQVILDHLKQAGINELYLEALRPDSAAFTHLIDVAKTQGYTTSCTLEDVSLDLELPPTWEEYLDNLSPKQRREVGRKLRRLYEAGDIEYRTLEDPDSVKDTTDLFFRLLRDSRPAKAAFMTGQMEAFFSSIAEAMAKAGLLRMGVLSIHTLPVASIMSFDYNDSIYLYNSGYDPPHGYLSVGLLSKVFSLKDSIERGRKRYDFLKGAEEYKYRLGGREIPVYCCHIALK